jgi:CRP/FNR family transcriptional regulator, anaerobic regulatory protein
MDTERFFKMLETLHPLSDEFKEFLKTNLIPLSLPARHILLDVPKVASHVYFLNEGFAMSYTVSITGKITESFWKPGQLIVAFESFFEQKASIEVIQLMKPSELLGISYETVTQSLARFPEAEILYRIIINRHYAHARSRVRKMKSVNHTEQYDNLLRIFPGLELIVSQRAIATYLGIAPQSLARIRLRLRSA